MQTRLCRTSVAAWNTLLISLSIVPILGRRQSLTTALPRWNGVASWNNARIRLHIMVVKRDCSPASMLTIDRPPTNTHCKTHIYMVYMPDMAICPIWRAESTQYEVLVLSRYTISNQRFGKYQYMSNMPIARLSILSTGRAFSNTCLPASRKLLECSNVLSWPSLSHISRLLIYCT